MKVAVKLRLSDDSEAIYYTSISSVNEQAVELICCFIDQCLSKYDNACFCNIRVEAG